MKNSSRSGVTRGEVVVSEEISWRAEVVRFAQRPPTEVDCATCRQIGLMRHCHVGVNAGTKLQQ